MCRCLSFFFHYGRVTEVGERPLLVGYSAWTCLWLMTNGMLHRILRITHMVGDSWKARSNQVLT